MRVLESRRRDTRPFAAIGSANTRSASLGASAYYAQELFESEELTGYLRNMLLETQKSVYEQVVYESEIERAFANELEKNDAVKLYAKLPGWFAIPTPLGAYHPDWAVLITRTTYRVSFDNEKLMVESLIFDSVHYDETLGLVDHSSCDVNELLRIALEVSQSLAVDENSSDRAPRQLSTVLQIGE